jgi:hypothetical protein
VWLVWRLQISYPLKEATLAAAALIAMPYAFAYDMTALVIPTAFLVQDQLSRGFLRCDKALWMLLFGAPLAVLVTLGDNDQTTLGGTPAGLLAAIALLAMILHRAVVMPAQACSPSGSALLGRRRTLHVRRANSAGSG